jgi:hypothetical protein
MLLYIGDNYQVNINIRVKAPIELLGFTDSPSLCGIRNIVDISINTVCQHNLVEESPTGWYKHPVVVGRRDNSYVEEPMMKKSSAPKPSVVFMTSAINVTSTAVSPPENKWFEIVKIVLPIILQYVIMSLQ